jgi:hypothetical protein
MKSSWNNGFMIFQKKKTLTYFHTLNKKMSWYILLYSYQLENQVWKTCFIEMTKTNNN